MSDTIETPPAPTAEQLAKKARIEQINGMVGKTFKRKTPNEKLPEQYFVVTNYLGVLLHGNGTKYATLLVESRNPADIKFSPSAVDFERDFEPFTPPKEANETPEII